MARRRGEERKGADRGGEKRAMGGGLLRGGGMARGRKRQENEGRPAGVGEELAKSDRELRVAAVSGRWTAGSGHRTAGSVEGAEGRGVSLCQFLAARRGALTQQRLSIIKSLFTLRL